MLFGAGGAARAIAVEAALAGAGSITVVNRSAAAGAALVEVVPTGTPATARQAAWTTRYRVLEDASVVVNATSIGLLGAAQQSLDLDLDLAPHMAVADVIPNSAQTAFLRGARRRGCVTLDGRGMLVNQAVIGVELWTGTPPEASVRRHALDAELGR